MQQQVDLYKKAGLSYQPQLALPLVVDCKDEEALRTLLGMYTFDANYAMAFGKAKESLETRKFIQEKLTPRLKERDKFTYDSPDPALVEKVLRDPNDAKSRRQMNEYVAAQFKKLAKAAEKDPEIMEVLVEGMYGTAIQGLYVASTLAMDMLVTPQIVTLFKEQSKRLKLFDKLIHNLKDETIRGILEQRERCAVVDTLVARLSAAKGKLTPQLIRDIQAIAAEARAKYAQPCK
jgi:hypothetical protein